MKRVVLALCVTVLVGASAAFASPKLHTSPGAQSNPLCAPVPNSIPRGLTAVWVQINIKSASNDPIREMGLAIRRYVRANGYKDQLGVFPGCDGLKLYKSSNVPGRLCVYVPRGYSVQGGACQPLSDGFNGAKQVAFFVVRDP